MVTPLHCASYDNEEQTCGALLNECEVVADVSLGDSIGGDDVKIGHDKGNETREVTTLMKHHTQTPAGTKPRM